MKHEVPPNVGCERLAVVVAAIDLDPVGGQRAKGIATHAETPGSKRADIADTHVGKQIEALANERALLFERKVGHELTFLRNVREQWNLGFVHPLSMQMELDLLSRILDEFDDLSERLCSKSQ